MDTVRVKDFSDRGDIINNITLQGMDLNIPVFFMFPNLKLKAFCRITTWNLLSVIGLQRGQFLVENFREIHLHILNIYVTYLLVMKNSFPAPQKGY